MVTHAPRRCNIKERRELRRSGFSLIELLVVVAVISVLASMLLPGMNEIRERAYVTVCMSNLRQIGFAFYQYAGNCRSKLPLYTTTNTNDRPANFGVWTNEQQNYFFHTWWGNTTGPGGTVRKKKGKYLDDHMVLYCPGLQRQDVSKLWWYWDGSAIPARNFDRLFCLEGSGRSNNTSGGGRRAPIGYTIMLSSRDIDGVIQCPTRKATGKKPLSITAKPTCWLFTDLYRVNTSTDRFSWWSHKPGSPEYLKYNVLHIDGHVDTHQARQHIGWSSGNVGGDWKRDEWSTSPYSYYDTDDDR